MARTSDLEKMSYAELLEMEAQIERLKIARQNSERASVRQRLMDLAKQHGFDIHDLFRATKGNRASKEDFRI
jgi:hypothetical protein